MLKTKQQNNAQNCKHQVVWDNNIKTMVSPITKYGYCIKCGNSCKKINGKIIWDD